MRWIEVDHRAIAHNVKSLQRALGSSRLWAVVKGQAYGHGAVEAARTAMAAGAAGLAVSALSEALELRDAGISDPLFVMNPVIPDQADLYVKHRIIASVADDEAARALAAANESGSSARAPVHVKVDTGLGRFGTQGDIVAFVRRLHTMPTLEVQGIFSHFAAADDADQTSALKQWEAFSALLDELERLGIRPPVAHIDNSPGALALPETRMQMVRSGLSVYGMYPSPFVRHKAEAADIVLKPALALKARVASVRRLPAGSPIGYGSTYVTERETTVVTLPIGYSDGVSRNLSGKLEVLVRGRRRPVIGRICMNHCIVDVDDIPVQIGDVITLLGQDGDERVTAEEWAQHLGTIAYEIVCMVGSRNPREHLHYEASGADDAGRGG